MDIFLNKKLISDIETDEYHEDELAQEFGLSFDWEEDQIITFNEGYGSPDSESIPIDILIGKLQKMKDAGATHVELEYHQDHLTYEIAGYQYSLASQSQIDEYLKRKAENEVKEAKVKELQKQIQTIRTSQV